MQQEVSSAADEAARLYLERTLPGDRTSRGIHDAMREASLAKVKSYRSEFDKLAAVAIPKNGPKFLEEVCIIFIQLSFDHLLKSDLFFLFICR